MKIILDDPEDTTMIEHIISDVNIKQDGSITIVNEQGEGVEIDMGNTKVLLGSGEEVRVGD